MHARLKPILLAFLAVLALHGCSSPKGGSAGAPAYYGSPAPGMTGAHRHGHP